jgi:cytidylate kinase
LEFFGDLKKIVIAIDGPAAAGKSTTARRVAEILGYLHIDTGAMYRALTLKVLRSNISLEAAEAIERLTEATTVRLERFDGENRIFVDGVDVTGEIRTPEVTKAVSRISGYAFVRRVMVREQRKLAEAGGAVLEGRDIGTVVLPDADLKIFMVANVSERARRRKKDLEDVGIDVDTETLVDEINKRDQQDSTREVSPLRKAQDAIELDTSSMSIETQVEFIVAKAKERLKK